MTVPFPPDDVRRALSDRQVLLRCVPGLQLDEASGAETGREVSGRLRLRVGGSTITYRGVLRLSGTGDEYRGEAEGREARGDGKARASLLVAVEAAESGTRLRMTGAAQAGGRIVGAGAQAAQAAGRRLMDRFASALVSLLEAQAERGREDQGGTEGMSPEKETRAPREEGEAAPAAEELSAEEPSAEEPVVEEPVVEEPAAGTPDEPPGQDMADLAPATARRTMIGRSAEEVDHAPPRGRYAPVPAPETSRTSKALRWAAPATALLASAVLVGRLLRRRR